VGGSGRACCCIWWSVQRFCEPCCCRHAATLLRRLEQAHKQLEAVRHMLPNVAQAADALAAYQLTHAAVQQFITNAHNEWYSAIEANVNKHLASCLLVQDRAAGAGRGRGGLCTHSSCLLVQDRAAGAGQGGGWGCARRGAPHACICLPPVAWHAASRGPPGRVHGPRLHCPMARWACMDPACTVPSLGGRS
jgi:hypothetical protein